MISALWLGHVALLTLVIVLMAFAVRDRPHSTRAVPADAFRVLTGVAFAAWVHPAFGLLAALSAFWWLRQGYLAMAGGTLWPLVAMAVALGSAASPTAIDTAIAILLAVGVLQVILGILQELKYPVCLFAAGTHGTIGHRTGFGIFLAVLIPLGYLTDYGKFLALVFFVGVMLSRSVVALGASVVGVLIVAPHAWAAVLVPAVIVGATRGLKFNRAYPLGMKFRHVRDSWMARWSVWRVTLNATRRWPHWLIGYGAESFPRRAVNWTTREGFREQYKEAHSDPIEFVFEYGLLGIIAVGLWLAHYGGFLALGDPVTGGLAAFGTASLANFPFRVTPLAGVALLMTIMVMRRAA